MPKRPYRTTAFRLPTPTVPKIPLRVRSCGRCEVNYGWSEPPTKKWFVELTWTLSGEGEVIAKDDKTRLHLNPGDVHLYYPGEIHHLRSLSNPWIYYWITLDHAEAEQWVSGFGLQRHQSAAHKCPENAFMATIDALRACSAEGERWAARRAHEILLAASARSAPISAKSTLALKAKLLMEESFRDPAFDLTELATRLEVHRSTLFRRFTEAHGVKPSSFLLNLRIQFSLNLLQNTSLTVQEIALKSGFTDANYFARAIRKATGRAPSDFRGPERLL